LLLHLTDQRAETVREAIAARTFPVWEVDEEVARRLSMGQRLAPEGLPPGAVAAIGPDESLVALVEERDDAVRPLTVFT